MMLIVKSFNYFASIMDVTKKTSMTVVKAVMSLLLLLPLSLLPLHVLLRLFLPNTFPALQGLLTSIVFLICSAQIR